MRRPRDAGFNDLGFRVQGWVYVIVMPLRTAKVADSGSLSIP